MQYETETDLDKRIIFGEISRIQLAAVAIRGMRLLTFEFVNCRRLSEIATLVVGSGNS